MPKESRVCTEVLNEIISRYSKIAFEKDTVKEEQHEAEAEDTEVETEEDFWTWFCGEMKTKSFKDCFVKNEREDFYGSLKTVRDEYESRCKDNK